jgi:hypothetical protein
LQEQKITKRQNRCRANRSKQLNSHRPKNIQQRLSKTNFHSHTHNRNKKLTMNRDCQEKKNKELKPRTA